MVHRAVRERERGPWWKLGRDLLVLAGGAVVFSTLYVLLSLVVHGTVNW